MSAEVQVSTLQPGTHFRMPWRPVGRDLGKLKTIGSGSCAVYIHKAEGGTEDTHWSPSTLVVPITAEEYATGARSTQEEGSTPRNRSTIESPVALVHRLCTELNGDRDKVIAAALEKGVNISTAKTQFYAWRKKNK